jgi:hypothetical protein
MSKLLATTIGRNGTSIMSQSPLSNDQIFRVAPSIFAPDAHESRSERYTYIPTVDILNGLRREGFEPFFAAQAKSRVPGKTEYTKHMVRLRHAGDITNQEGANEIILVNSHDGTSSYQLLAGFFRFVCQNGMVAGETVENQRVQHKGDIAQNVIECAYRVLDDMDKVTASRENMQSITLVEKEQRLLATAALGLRFGMNDAGLPAAPVSPDRALWYNRTEDRGNDLWKTFNRLQENLVRGGMRGHNANGGRTTTREVQGVDGLVGLNRALWTLAEGMAALKQGTAA